MKSNLSFITLIATLAGRCCFAQPTAPAIPPTSDSKPASSNVPGQQYPRIDSELRATFRVSAPTAQKVGVHVNRADYDMAKGEDGNWMVTTKILEPGFHYYNLFIDGVNVADPASESFFGISKMSSGIEVPSKGEDFYDAKEVPHGEVKALFISVGTAENPANVKRNHEALDAAGIKNVYYESPDTAHEWQTWRRSFHQFAPLLFKD